MNSPTDILVTTKGKPRSRKMKITELLNTVDGETIVVVRASGIYKGRHIERSASVPERNLGFVDRDCLRKAAVAGYRRETEIIDEKLKTSDNGKEKTESVRVAPDNGTTVVRGKATR